MLNVPDVQASDLPFLSRGLLIPLIWYQCFTQYASILSQSENSVTPHGGTLTQLSLKPIETRFRNMKDLMSKIVFKIIISGSKGGL